ncbi:MAG: hypothetical protein M1834_002358 [Cirrosporium novae-zelandiae]|nr:MAG: hypothetical protein M1834_002358 [Cirrosporium novae-zelandiae]
MSGPMRSEDQLPVHEPTSPQASSSRSRRADNARNSFSALFHSTSEHASENLNEQKPISSKSPRLNEILGNRRLSIPPPAAASPSRRSQTSTRSVIDPDSSPMSTTGPASAIPTQTLEAIMTASSSERSRSHTHSTSGRSGSHSHRHSHHQSRSTYQHRRHLTPEEEILSAMGMNLALALSNTGATSEFQVFLLLLILIITILFCHSLVRLCMVLLRNPSYNAFPSEAAVGPGGYAQLDRPIRVVLARDEEIAEDSPESDVETGQRPKEAVKMPPPAYGLWRSSVRVDPNLIYWQRADAPPLPQHPSLSTSSHPTSRSRSHTNDSTNLSPVSEMSSSPSSSPNEYRSSQQFPRRPTSVMSNMSIMSANSTRPPSYLSDDGVRYVVEATPRSVAPAEVSGGLARGPSVRGGPTGLRRIREV